MSFFLGLLAVESFILLLINGSCSWRECNDCSGETYYEKRYSKLLVFVFAFILIVVAGLRNKFWDTGDYRYMYMAIGTDISNVFNGTVPRVEKGYLLFTYCLNLINSDSQFLLIVCSIITNGLFVYTIYKESEDVPFSLFIYLCTSFLGTMNGLRQILVAAIVFFFGAKWSKTRSLKSNVGMLFCILVMASFHKSVLICLPIYWITKGKRFNFLVKCFACFSILLFLIPGLSTSVISVLGNSNYSDYQNVTATQSVLRFVVGSIPVILCLLCNLKNELDESISANQNWMINLTVIGFCFNLLALRMVYYARINMYFGIADLIMLPTYIELLFKGGNARIVKIVAIICYGYYYYASLVANGSYVTNFMLML